MNLAKVISECQGWLTTTKDNTIIDMLTSFEEYVDQAYQGRLLYELIQNARDAAHMNETSSDIYIEISEDSVIFANTGKGFDEDGVWAMSRLGISKKDKDLIGKKGIGFKAIQQFTKTPRIATAYGTMLFDRTKLHNLLVNMFPEKFDEDSNVPLFLYPHYEDATSGNYSFEGKSYDTVVSFNLDNERPAKDIIAMFKDISYDDLVLLGNINSIIFKADKQSEQIYIDEGLSAIKSIRGTRGEKTFKFFQPDTKIELPVEIYEQLDKKQKKLYAKNRELDMKLVFHLDKQGVPIAQASKLFLYYPLDMLSGFNYIIHADFNVNPERTKLLSTPLNTFLFKTIISFKMNTILPYLKSIFNDNRILDFVKYTKGDQRPNELLELYKARLLGEEFIWVENQKVFAGPSKILLCSSEEYELFSNHVFNGRYPIVVGTEQEVFLHTYLEIPKLLQPVLLQEIEAICENQKHSPMFFEKLYKYCILKKIDMHGRKILLGSSGQLFSHEQDIFHQVKNLVRVPEAISNKLLLLHEEISIATQDAQNCYSLTGIKEYKVIDLVQKALALMRDDAADRFEILRFFKELPEISDPVHLAFREKMLLPARKQGGEVEWHSPVTVPMYIESEGLLELYPHSYYIALDKCCKKEDDLSDWISFLVMYAGAWNCPAMYIDNTKITHPRHVAVINALTKKSIAAYNIINDRILDFPANPNEFFFDSVLKNWQYYSRKSSEFPFRLFVTSEGNDRKLIDNGFKVSSFLQLFKIEKWIFTANDTAPLQSEKIFGINRSDFNVERLLEKHINLLPIDYLEASCFFDDLGILHFNSESTASIIGILDRVSKKFILSHEGLLSPVFKKFYHVLLKYLYKVYAAKDTLLQEQLFSGLRGIKVLGTLKTAGIEKAYWALPGEIYYLDDKNLYDQLPDDAKEQLGPVFTKTDRNEIGKIFMKIGKSLTDAVIASVKHSEINENSELLITSVANLPYLVHAVENKIERQLEENELNILRDLACIECRDIYKEVILIPVEGYSKRISIDFDYEKGNKRVLVKSSSYPLSRSAALQGEVMDAVLSAITGRELGLARVLWDFANPKSSDQFIYASKISRIDEERVQELYDIFFEHRKSPVQEFWNAVLLAKGIIDIDLDTENGEIDTQQLLGIINSSQEEVLGWIKDIDYRALNSESNILIFRKLFENEQIDLNSLSGYLGTDIDFTAYLENEIESYKKRYNNQASSILYSYFIGQPITEKKKFNAIIDTLNKIAFKGVVTHLNFSVPEIFQSLLQEKFPFSGFTQNLLEKTDPILWAAIRRDFPKRRNNITKLLTGKGSDNMHINAFLLKDSVVSLLFFEEYDQVVEMYLDRYGKKEEETVKSQVGGTEKLNYENTDEGKDSDDDDDELPIVDVSLKNTSERGENPLDQAVDAIGKAPGGWGGGSGWGSTQLPQNYLRNIGARGELRLFKKLKKLYGDDNVYWVSENAADFGEIPQKIAFGYDMYYIDKDGQTHYVEVKSSTREEPEFYISINEVKAARKYGNRYHVIWITHVFDVKHRAYSNLGNMFYDFPEDENFFFNRRYQPQLNTFKITFTTMASGRAEVKTDEEKS